MANDDYILSHYANVAKQFGHSPQSTIEDQAIREAETFYFTQALKKIMSQAPFNKKEVVRVLDLGCGNGITIEKLHKVFPKIQFTGLEFTPELFNLCVERKLPEEKVHFLHGDMREPLPEPELNQEQKFDIILTQRSVINILGKNKQVQALRNIADALSDGGHYLLSESFYESWASLNHARAEFQMEEMPVSKHNLYLTESRIQTLKKCGLCEYHHEIGRYYLSTHFYLTRVIHPLLKRPGDRHLAPHFLKFMTEGFGPGVGQYGPLQFRWFQKV